MVWYGKWCLVCLFAGAMKICGENFKIFSPTIFFFLFGIHTFASIFYLMFFVKEKIFVGLSPFFSHVQYARVLYTIHTYLQMCMEMELNILHADLCICVRVCLYGTYFMFGNLRIWCMWKWKILNYMFIPYLCMCADE